MKREPSFSKRRQGSSREFLLRDDIKQHLLYWPANKLSSQSVLLLHGYSNDAHIWDSLAPRLQEKYNVYAIDFRGHGDSDWSMESHYNYEVLVEDIHEVVRHLKLDSFHMIGHSLGALVAALYNQHYQPHLQSFTIVDVGPEIGNSAICKLKNDADEMPRCFKSLHEYKNYLESIYFLSDQHALNHIAEYGLKPLPNGGFTPKTDPCFGSSLWHCQSDNEEDFNVMRLINNQLWKALACIAVPTLILKGQYSAVLSDVIANKMTNEIIENAKISVVSRAGHAVMIDNPEDFERVIMSFIDKIKMAHA